jgi:hypothetical protein|tara:strand:- start:8251 stop:8832 length:582 start_codon:yes stop_codon:yes gene_type:complete
MAEALRDPRPTDEAFANQLASGEAMEAAVVRWLKSRGSHARRAEGPIWTPCGPRKVRRPDIVVMPSDGRMYWLEVKSERTWSYRITQDKFEFSILAEKVRNYADLSWYHQIPCFLLLIVSESEPPEADLRQACRLRATVPSEYPTGVWCCAVEEMAHSKRREEDTEGGPMWWWASEDLHKLCELGEFREGASE